MTALNAFDRYLQSESMSMESACSRIGSNQSGDTIYHVLDGFGMYFVQSAGVQGKQLAKNSVLSYFGNVKNHLLDLYPYLYAVSNRRLQKVATTIEKHCSKRDTEVVNQAPPCTKAELKTLALTIYEHAATPSEYKDAALVIALWYLMRRSSDAISLLKSHISVYPGTSMKLSECFVVRLIIDTNSCVMRLYMEAGAYSSSSSV